MAAKQRVWETTMPAAATELTRLRQLRTNIALAVGMAEAAVRDLRAVFNVPAARPEPARLA